MASGVLKKSSSGWILGPWRDLVFFIATPALILPLMLWGKDRWELATLSIWILGLGGFGHHLPGFIRAYSDPELLSQYRIRLIAAPIAVTLIAAYFAYHNLNGLTFIVALWGAWHGALQTHGFARIYDAMAKRFNRFDAWVDWVLCIGWFGAVILHSDDKVFVLVAHYFRSGGWEISAPLFQGLRWVWDFALVLAVLIYGYRILVAAKKGVYPNWKKIGAQGAAFTFWWFCVIGAENLLLGILMWEIFHDTQSNGLVWRFQRQRFESGSRVGTFERLLFSPGWTRAILYLVLISAYGYLGVLGSFGELQSPEPVAGAISHAWVFKLLLISAMLHFYFDGFIWKLSRKSQQLSLGLIKDGKDLQPKTTQRNNPLPQIIHFAGWSAFGLALLVFGYRESRGLIIPEDSQFSNLVKVLPNSWRAHFMFGGVLKSNGAWAEAENEFQEVVRCHPGFSIGHLFAADMAFRRHDYGLAKTHYLKAVETDSTNYEAHRNLAFLSSKMGDAPTAITQFRASIKMDPENPDLYSGLGVALIKAGAFAEAVVQFQRAILLKPDHEEANYYLELLAKAN